jgi:hypothetical protein
MTTEFAEAVVRDFRGRSRHRSRHTKGQLNSTAHARFKNAARAESCRRAEPSTGGGVGLGGSVPVVALEHRSVSMQIDRASTEKVIAMLGLTLSFLLLLAIIALAFV